MAVTPAMPASPATASPALKEWAPIIRALAAGAQTLVLRKGGIAEGRGGFDPARATRFWLLPTAFHAEPGKLKPAAAPFLDAPAASPASGGAAESPATAPTLDTWAELIAHRFVSDWAELAALDAQHLYAESTVRERHAWAKPPGVFVLLLRVRRLHAPLALPAGTSLGGCKSWIELPLPDPGTLPSVPALDDAAFAAARAAAKFA